SAIMPQLKMRFTAAGDLRMVNSVQPPTMPAPAGPTSTTAASIAAELADHVRSVALRNVAVDWQRITSNPSTTTSCHQAGPPNGPVATRTAAVATTTPI